MSDMTIRQWCAKRNYSITTFYNLKKQGHAPELIEPPGIDAPRITLKADADWEKKMRLLAKQKAARREAERRSKQTQMAGRIGAKSLLHHSNRKRQG
jgi:hypothetical protein